MRCIKDIGIPCDVMSGQPGAEFLRYFERHVDREKVVEMENEIKLGYRE